ncbi:NAD(P)H-dependent oxidoreductase [Brevibacillus choshinensis]|uniref:NAD(P)H-dependent oxidoreductase n=1 Tax=Brevibacillus choshinensis TaxID=54911 RepID=A0ABX7FSA0_BRECH|nr:NAD(P)H-dependent oxidoreductase [Brevibacillus choshinensis]QRG68685.1 NAD(P)H-dependent oxidoreductase [Brevibacillus choshinensis]
MKIMVIAAHPKLTESRANRALLDELKKHDEVVIRDLYQEYPGYDIDVQREQELLLEYDRVVFQFPFYWYSCPPLLKKWFDDVLTHGWAFGPGGDHLLGKEFMIATTAGGTERAYRSGGDDLYTISELLRPIERTLTKCNGTFLPAFVVYNADRASNEVLALEAKRYAEHVRTSLRVLAH